MDILIDITILSFFMIAGMWIGWKWVNVCTEFSNEFSNDFSNEFSNKSKNTLYEITFTSDE